MFEKISYEIQSIVTQGCQTWGPRVACDPLKKIIGILVKNAAMTITKFLQLTATKLYSIKMTKSSSELSKNIFRSSFFKNKQLFCLKKYIEISQNFENLNNEYIMTEITVKLIEKWLNLLQKKN